VTRDHPSGTDGVKGEFTYGDAEYDSDSATGGDMGRARFREPVEDLVSGVMSATDAVVWRREGDRGEAYEAFVVGEARGGRGIRDGVNVRW
jgi:hypothetical protein